MKLPINCIATKALLLLALLFMGALAYAAEMAGTVVNLSGPLFAQTASGSVKVLAEKSSVEQGDILITEKDTYARIRFADNSEITLRPNSQFKIDNFSFDEAKPEADSAFFSLIKGGLRAVTGVLGKRSRERVGVSTPTATIGIRGTTFVAEYVEPSPADEESPSSSGGRSPGLYAQVLDGMIFLTNDGGTLDVDTGQFAYAQTFQLPPVLLPDNPGMQFTLPAGFQVSAGEPQPGADSSGASTIICEVR